MNNSNAAAKRRRAGIQPTTPPMPPTPQNQPAGAGAAPVPSPNAGLTLPQVIALIDTRLVTLETFMKETKESTDLSLPDYSRGDDAIATEGDMDSSAVFMDSKEFTTFVEDINQRFQLFADEINGLKEIVLKLQGFTMDVNKMLLATISKNGDTIPNITMETVVSEPEVEQTSVAPPEPSVDDVNKAVTSALATSGKNKKK